MQFKLTWRYQADNESWSVCNIAPSLCVCVCVFIYKSTEWSQHMSHQSEHAVFCGSLCVFQVQASHKQDKGSAGWSKSQTRSLTPPGCWPGARAGAVAGVTEGPQGQGSSGSGQVREGRRSSGAEWCWETVVEFFTLPLLHSFSFQFYQRLAYTTWHTCPEINHRSWTIEFQVR